MVKMVGSEVPPILFLIFNRPDSVNAVFEKIRQIKPRQLFIAADGPRYPLKNEFNLCLKAREIVNKVDWECEVKTLFQDKNFGVGRGGVEGITWFFQHVDAGIILEDDCVPSDEFFTFCSLGLEQFKHDPSVMMLAGTNYLFGKYSHLEGFYRSKHYAIWGWATWRRAWNLYSYTIPDWGIQVTYRDLKDFFSDKLIAQRWAGLFDDIKHNRLEAWDAQWVFACAKHKAFSICIPANMVSNIGYLGGHANGTVSPFHEMPYQVVDVQKSLQHELPDKAARLLDWEVYNRIGFFHRISLSQLFRSSIKKRFPFLKKMYEFIKNS